MKKLVIFFVTAVIVTFTISAHAGWLFYYKPEFRGKVVDAGTKEPIEGAVVVVLYERWKFGGPGGGNTLPMDAKETLTDKNGEFFFPAYSTLIGPLSRSSEASFIIFKPGYMSVTRIHGIQMPDERYFTIQKDMVGKKGEITYVDRWERTFSYKGPLGIVDMKRGEKDPLIPTHYRSKELPLLFNALNEDRINRGYKGELK
jgi:hypothetical protein